MTKLSQAQIKTLGTIIRNGGEMNGYAGQSGFYCNSKAPLTRMGLIERVPNCPNCDEWGRGDQPCQKHDSQRCYDRIRITDAGRTAYQEATR